MKKLICSLLACLMLAGCAAPAGSSSSQGSGSQGSSSGSASSVNSSDTGGSTENQVKITPETPVDFTWKPQVISNYQHAVWGEEREALYGALVDAIMTGKTSVPCADEEMGWTIQFLLDTNFPVMSAVVSYMNVEDNNVKIKYSVSDAEREQIIKDFAEKIESEIESSVCQADTPSMAALALYHQYCMGLTYDHEAEKVEAEFNGDTIYRALMSGTGTNQSFAIAYAYLCMQIGVNAVEVVGHNVTRDNPQYAVLMELNGHHYFSQPGDECLMGGAGLRCFAGNRACLENGGEKVENIGMPTFEGNVEDYDTSDDNFYYIWAVQNCEEIKRTEQDMEIKGYAPLKADCRLYIEDGKTMTVVPEM